MNKHFHAQSEAAVLEHDINAYSADELENLYGIVFLNEDETKNGPVLDTVTGREFSKIADWVAAQIEEESWSDSEHHQTSRKFDEDF